MGVWLLRASSRSIRRPSGASTTTSAYVPGWMARHKPGGSAEDVGDRCRDSAGAERLQAVGLLDRAQHVVVSDLLAVPAGLDVRAGEDRHDLVACTPVVLVPRDDQQAVVGRRPADVAADVRLQPGVALRDRAVVHVVEQVRVDERDRGQARVAGRELGERVVHRWRQAGEVRRRVVLAGVLATAASDLNWANVSFIAGGRLVKFAAGLCLRAYSPLPH